MTVARTTVLRELVDLVHKTGFFSCNKQSKVEPHAIHKVNQSEIKNCINTSIHKYFRHRSQIQYKSPLASIIIRGAQSGFKTHMCTADNLGNVGHKCPMELLHIHFTFLSKGH